MPVRVRLPLALAVCALATAGLSLTLWQAAKDDVRDQARERTRGTSAALEQRAGAAVLALQGVRAAYDASSSVGPAAFSTFARVPLARPEIAAVGWVPLVAASQRGEVEQTERIRIEAPAGKPFTYPLVRQEPAATSLDVLDLGSDPSLVEALRTARTTGEPRLSAPIRLPGDGRIGVYAFVPVFAKGLPLRTAAQRRSALTGLVAGAVVTSELIRTAMTGLPKSLDVRVSDGPTVLAEGPTGTAIAHAELGGRTWRISLAPAAPSPLAPFGVAFAGLALMLLLVLASIRLRRRAASEAALETTLTRERTTSAHALARAESTIDEEQRTRRLVADASDAVVLDIDRDGLIKSCSTAAEQLLGYTADELVGIEVYSLLHPDDLLSPANGPQRYARKDGTYVVLEGRRLPRRDELGFVSGLVTVLRGPAPLTARTAEQRIHDAVALEPDPVELFSIVAEEIALDLGVGAAAVVRFETGGFGTIVGASEPAGASRLVPGTTVPLEGDEPAAHVFRTGQATPGTAPIRVGARLWGALVAEGADAGRLLELALASQPAVAFADASAQLAALATRDQLTNLPDHRAFHEQLRSEARRAQRHERALSLVLVNIDGFKRINAEHGRLAGDRVLAEVGRRLAATVRNGELVSRLSADHFGWILPETEGLNGWIAAERARRALAAAPIAGVGYITASAGVCDFEDVGGADELLALSEIALVHAKGSGGDATFRYSAELDGDDGELEVEDDGGLSRLRALARDLDAEDPGTEGHSERVSRLSEKLALSCGWNADLAIRLAQAALLHDVGKLGIGEAVLGKPGKLSASELEQIRNHPDTGAELAVKALDDEQLGWIRHHHERWDGTGYPNGVAGEAIPVGGRLLALAEAWDAMTSSRVYGEALSAADALAECKRERGLQFAPEAIDALDRLWALGALDSADVRSSTSD
ncbi:MAG TPA: HD domain-containing phosphohydrolase [Gaiellaceae bacterium]|nr:HD domain-containing phosphohydrolase [Gaiellaceae bacterium]